MIYPKIKIQKRPKEVRYESWVRIKRYGLWFEVKCVDFYESESRERFIDMLVLTKLYWEPAEKGALSYLKPSENQNDTKDDLLDDVHRVNRLKKGLMVCKK